MLALEEGWLLGCGAENGAVGSTEPTEPEAAGMAGAAKTAGDPEGTVATWAEGCESEGATEGVWPEGAAVTGAVTVGRLDGAVKAAEAAVVAVAVTEAVPGIDMVTCGTEADGG